MATFPTVLNRWTIDRFYTETVRELSKGGMKPSEVAEEAKSLLVKGFAGDDIPDYVSTLGASTPPDERL